MVPDAKKRNKWEPSLPKNIKMCKYFCLHAYFWLFYQYLYKRSTFLALSSGSPGHSHTGSLFIDEEQKKVGL